MNAISVVIATCNRPYELGECLFSLSRQTLPPREVIVVDDAPGDERTPAVVDVYSRMLPVSYVRGRRRGLADAHNIGVALARAPLVALTDDDVVADPGWLEALVAGFGHSPGVACVTGCIRALELATPAQRILDAYARFDKGGERAVFDLHDHRPADRLFPLAAGRFGSGANMAFTRAVLRELDGFDPALGAGTRARGGDDLSAFFEVVQRGHRLVYEPRAIVRHRHARDLDAVRRQVFGYGVGLTAYLTKSLLERPGLIAGALRAAPAAARHILSPASPKNGGRPPAQLRRLERMGMLVGPFAYILSRRQARSAA